MSDQQRQDERLLAGLRFLAARSEPAPRKEVWDAALSQVPMSATESTFVPSRPEPRGRNAFWFGTSTLGRAGLLQKSGDGLWSITDVGRRVLADDPDPTEFRKEATRAAREVTKALRADRTARLSVVILPPDAGAERIRDASLRFRERGLRQLSSVFAEHRSVWRPDVSAELVRCFAEQEEVAGDSFLDKLREQFADASDDARLLMAELVAWQLLPLQSPGERKKRERVQALLDLMREPVLIPAEVDQAFRSWSFNPGQGMAQGIHNALSIVIRLVDRWVGLADDERDSLLEDPWAWRDFVAAVPGTAFPTQRNELMYLVHPESFGEVISAVDRERIRTVFRGEVAGGTEAIEVVDDPDREFLDITLALQTKENGPAVYYREPLRSRWATAPATRVESADEQLSPITDRPSTGDRTSFPAVTSSLASGLHMPERWLQDTVDLIERRKQVILYGPPGTGKTFLAQALSKHVTDGTDGETTIVQFHPTYSYEDFFEGFRPVANDDSGNLAFTLRKGPLRRLADAAAANPEANYFLVIDEINRGNIAKVFGELYFLLEYRDSEISLLYSDEPFTLPSNIFVIGTMNTADRSIAMLDAAMRRRFAFIELHPEREPVQNVLSRWAATKGLRDDRADLLTRLNAQIQDHDAKVGPSFLMRDLAGTGLQDVWRYEILPLLAEHHYGEGVDLEARYGLAMLRRRTTPTPADGAEGASDDD
ncbi:AAA family ATPase [Curtobacterium sp. MCPF17_002]|uniref:AAA family ATPase n=1 Tax=Curtobacterium sp. MCPF17_002 TaxID=2175645 RepID=UPI000DA8B9AD|nr:AAA family ATPase [Curtobacterium sp. MCPF17_002]WIB78770.1 AAA family ATPase [Curtobacterium sp. MCPF17_002]